MAERLHHPVPVLQEGRQGENEGKKVRSHSEKMLAILQYNFVWQHQIQIKSIVPPPPFFTMNFGILYVKMYKPWWQIGMKYICLYMNLKIYLNLRKCSQHCVHVYERNIEKVCTLLRLRSVRVTRTTCTTLCTEMTRRFPHKLNISPEFTSKYQHIEIISWTQAKCISNILLFFYDILLAD